MNKLLAGSIAIALFLIAGCAASGPKLASSAEDIAGTWHSTIASVELRLNADGTSRVQFGDGSANTGEFRFEGTRLYLKPLGGSNECVEMGAETGIYEVELLESGNLKFTVIEDDCLSRVNTIAGRLIEAEWEPVP